MRLSIHIDSATEAEARALMAAFASLVHEHGGAGLDKESSVIFPNPHADDIACFAHCDGPECWNVETPKVRSIDRFNGSENSVENLLADFAAGLTELRRKRNAQADTECLAGDDEDEGV